MPNWCSYSVEFRGNQQSVQSLHEAFCVPEDEQPEHPDDLGIYDITRVRPCPDELKVTARWLPEETHDDDEETKELRKLHEQNLEKYGCKHWYEWCVANWGTKWPPSVNTYSLGSSYIALSGETAWGPPTELISYITRKYAVTAVVSYNEGGMCFAGADGYANGELKYSGYFDYGEVDHICDKMQLLAEVDQSDDDAWFSAEQEYSEAVYNEVDERENKAAKALRW